MAPSPEAASTALEGGGILNPHDTEENPCRIPHHPPGVNFLDTLGAELLEASDLGLYVVGLYVQVNAGVSIDLLHHELQARHRLTQRGIVGVFLVRLRAVAECARPEVDDFPVLLVGYVDKYCRKAAPVHGAILPVSLSPGQ